MRPPYALVVAAALGSLTPSAYAIEEPRFDTLLQQGPLEVRRYAPYMVAEVRVGGEFEQAGNRAFRLLANYIFGGNQRGESIAMTAPVHMQMGEQGSEMAFVMPASYTMESLPRPNDPSVTLVKSRQETVASIRFGGWASDEKLADEAAMLAAWLGERGIRITGPWRYLGYNAPWKVMGRRNEVIFPIELPR